MHSAQWRHPVDGSLRLAKSDNSSEQVTGLHMRKVLRRLRPDASFGYVPIACPLDDRVCVVQILRRLRRLERRRFSLTIFARHVMIAIVMASPSALQGMARAKSRVAASSKLGVSPFNQPDCHPRKAQYHANTTGTNTPATAHPPTAIGAHGAPASSTGRG